MNRKLKAIGLALFAAFAFSAIGAQAASADKFVSEVNDTVLTTTAEHDEAKGKHKFVFSGSTVECNITKFAGTLPTTAETEVTITPTYEDCTFGGAKAKVRTNHCGYVFTAETVEHEGKEEDTHAPVHVECESHSEHVEVEVPGFGHCLLTIDMPETVEEAGEGELTTWQTTTRGVTYADVGGDVTINITAEVEVTRHTNENFFCELLAHSGTGVYTGKSLLQGYKYVSGPSTEFTKDETAATENRGITHWTWVEGDPVNIGADTG